MSKRRSRRSLAILGITVASLAAPLAARAAAPVARDDVYEAQDGRLLEVAAPGVLANDSDADGNPLSVIVVTDAADFGSLSVFANGSFRYTPDPGFTGVDSFGYRISDGTTTAQARAFIQVPDGSPVAVDDLYLMPADEILEVAAPGLLENDFDLDGDPLQVTLIIDAPDHGSVSVFAGGSFRYTPDAGFEGADRFGYRVSDGFSTADAIVSIGVPEPGAGAAALSVLALAGLGRISRRTRGFARRDTVP